MPLSLKAFLEKWLNSQRLCTIVFFWCALRLITGVVQAFSPINSPHIWRQVDTLGTSLRYWMRWTVEGGSSHPILPAVLNSGDSEGIMAMEFPLLNILAAPSFFFGIDWGRIVASLLLVALVSLLAFVSYRVWSSLQEKPFPSLVLLFFPIFSFASGFTFKFIPDLIANQLMLLGVGILWVPRKRLLMILGIICMCLAGLMKPVAFLSTGVFLLHPKVFRWPLRIWIAGILSLSSLLYYYLVAIPWIQSLQAASGKFAVEARSPLDALLSFGNETILSQLDFFSYHALTPLLIIFVALTWFFQKPPTKLLLVLALQIFAVALLDGSHAYMHAYYFIPTAPLWAAVFFDSWSQAESVYVRLVLFLFVTSRLLETSFMDLTGFFDPKRPSAKFSECRMLREKHQDFPWGKGLVFRSSSEIYPLLGLCFGERQDSQKSEFGFFYLEDNLPGGCVEVGNSRSFKIARCI